MCGIYGAVARHGFELDLSTTQADAMEAGLAYRGPDGGDRWVGGSAVLGHRRLAIRGLGEAGRQPMTSADGRWVLVYNGELYQDAELRARLAPRPFRTTCDAETVLAALEAWGDRAPAELRGMYAFAAYDTRSRRLLLARDRTGRKPLYWSCDGRELVFASAPAAVLAHPRVRVEPDLHMVSAYLTTIRTSLAGRTLFRGVHALQPGEVLSVDLDAPVLRPRLRRPHAAAPVDLELTAGEAADLVRETLVDTTRRHLVSEVKTCSLLSGGLDSSVIASIARSSQPGLETWCAGTPSQGSEQGPEQGDLEHARRMAEHLGTAHAEVTVDREAFLVSWREMIDRLGLPLSTPNEVAIRAVTAGLRAGGAVVALSGEGADELFAGYAPTLAAAQAFEQLACDEQAPSGLSGGRFQLESAAWASPAVKGALLNDSVWRGLEEDAFVISAYDELFERGREEAGPGASPLDAHLRFQRRVNLQGLLERLDTASMLSGVEGRTPFADEVLVEVAERLPMHHKIQLDGSGAELGKRVLREAFREELPEWVLERPKASFPLPFQGWLREVTATLDRSPFARALFTPDALEQVARDPEGLWSIAWPLANVSLWGDRWWG